MIASPLSSARIRHPGTKAGRARAAGVFLLLTAGCITSMRSTAGGRREARRECLAAARNGGWRVIDIGEAIFKGAANYQVSLIVEKDSIPRQTLSCAYDTRQGTIILTKVAP